MLLSHISYICIATILCQPGLRSLGWNNTQFCSWHHLKSSSVMPGDQALRLSVACVLDSSNHITHVFSYFMKPTDWEIECWVSRRLWLVTSGGPSIRANRAPPPLSTATTPSTFRAMRRCNALSITAAGGLFAALPQQKNTGHHYCYLLHLC